MIQPIESPDASFTLFAYEEKMLDQAEAMVQSLDRIPEGLPEGFSLLRDAYRRSYRESHRLLRISDRLQLDLHRANQQLSEQTTKLQALNDQLHEEIQHRKVLEAELRRMATTDELTGISNRRHILELGEHEVRRHRRTQQPLTLMLCDLDYFKQVNDCYGHGIGDDVLCHFADLFRSELREGDVAGRLGGEEFLGILPETTLDDGLQVAERLRERLAQAQIQSQRGPIQLTLSIGVASLAKDEPLNRAIARADRSLYRAKDAGRNQVVADTPDAADAPITSD
ncbi:MULTISPECIES: GGDEF domain-containing protein [Thiorhodovibrio]|uniref:GGDEF domain-containing protein n=1 Tax=Thiorhodovibrio TaxID=61593 RepID=UPI001911A744|nr:MULTISPECIES: GGDEF domain-containing protein [Thiorhodovibrio]MBK5968854.1 GGDEF domain-containing protein [Thiorhodovibrio winogradskyi]WPL12624.1 putative diguanylate cyclase YdaM [Thiorhodovibrio litoralis]